jgi:hypothetical protein
MTQEPMWKVDIAFTEDDDHTRADAFLEVAGTEYRGWGRAKRNPTDANIPRIGEEIAAARALHELASRLLGAAEHDIGSAEGHPVTIYS